MRTLRSIALATAMLTLAACGGEAATTATPTASETPTSETTSATAQQDVEIVDFTFEPGSREVAVGEDVTWANRDDFAHTVTAGQPNEPTGRFDQQLGEINNHDSSGATFTTTFEEPGTFAYFCSLHPSMTGEIVVTGS